MDVFSRYMTTEKTTENQNDDPIDRENEMRFTRSFEYWFQRRRQQHHDRMKYF